MGKSTAGESAARRIVTQRSGGVCELCGNSQATDYQHRKNRSQGGAWCPSGALHCCSRCHHERIHAQPQEAIRNGWTVPSHADPAGTPVWLTIWAGTGWYYLADDGTYQPCGDNCGPP